jgi:tetratricopeptide (TPR) repeat protein
MNCPSCQADNAPGVETCFTCGAPLSAIRQGSVVANRYEIRRLIGKGGMGIVYEAHDRWLDEAVALKVLSLEQTGTPEAHKRFLAEIKLARKVTHPNVCRIHEYGEAEGGVSYISMELLEGKDLRQLLDERPLGLPTEEAFSAALQMAAGLWAIHEVGIIHRDLKTPNAMRDAKGVVKLMDFGIAKDLSKGGLTKTGEVMGTPEYMSPEQCRGEKLDQRSDIYALGIVIFEVFTGDVPFTGDNAMATLFKQVQEPVPFEGPLGSRLPPAVVPVLRKALAKAPADRYASVADLARDLRRGQELATAPAPEATGAAPLARPPAPPVAPAATGERRTQERLQLALDVRLCRLGSDGAILHEERTIADNISRHGARVMTAVPDLEVGDRAILKEVGGDFVAPAVVRHHFVAPDNIPRVGLEFSGVEAPDRLVATEEQRQTLRASRVTFSAPVTTQPAAAPAARGSAGPATRAGKAASERRRHNRLGITVNLILTKLGPEGRVVKQERTIADNISRGGARILTSIPDLALGDAVVVKELEGDFEARGVVRNLVKGPDSIPRVGIEFLDHAAPDRLVLTDDQRAEQARTRPPVERQHPETPSGSQEPAPLTPEQMRAAVRQLFGDLKRNHFEVLGVTPEASTEEIGHAYRSLARRFHPDAVSDVRLSDVREQTSAIFIRVGEAWDVLRDPEQRARYERRLGLKRDRDPGVRRAPTPGTAPTPPTPQPRVPVAPPPRSAPPPAEAPAPTEEDAEHKAQRVAALLNRAKKHIAAAQYWDAIQLIEPVIEEIQGTRLSIPARILLARAVGKNPKWQKRAEQILLEVIGEEPRNVDAHVDLGSLYRSAGIESRARKMLTRALELSPGHPAASAELDALDKQTSRRGA